MILLFNHNILLSWNLSSLLEVLYKKRESVTLLLALSGISSKFSLIANVMDTLLEGFIGINILACDIPQQVLTHLFFYAYKFLLTSHVTIFSASHCRIDFPYLFSFQWWAERPKNVCVFVCACACVASGVYTFSGHFTLSLFHPRCFMWSAVALQTWPAPVGRHE